MNANATTSPTLSDAVRTLVALESRDEDLRAEADALRARLAEINDSAFARQDEVAHAYHAVIAAAKRESS